MFEFFLKYPRSAYARGQFALLGAWPKWVLVLLIVAAAASLAALIFSRLRDAAPIMRSWRAWVIWALETLLAVILLLLLWQPAITVAELKPQQNIIAVLVDDSRSMAISENGSTREAQAVKALQNGVMDALNRSFQTRLYRVDDVPARVEKLNELKPDATSTRLGDSLKQLADEQYVTERVVPGSLAAVGCNPAIRFSLRRNIFVSQAEVDDSEPAWYTGAADDKNNT